MNVYFEKRETLDMVRHYPIYNVIYILFLIPLTVPRKLLYTL